MNNLTFYNYVNALTSELGPHYMAANYEEKRWIGFIYCECYYGSPDNRDHRPMRGLGAVARIEHNRVIILDHRQSYDRTKQLLKSDDGSSDNIVINMAQPNFHSEFMKIKLIHDEMSEFFRFKEQVLEYESADAHE